MNVSLINFPDNDSLKLQKILQLSKTNSYTICPFNQQSETDLLFFYGENYFQQAEFTALPEQQHSRVIVVAKQMPTQTNCHYAALPLIASRVLNLLDRINLNQPVANADILKSMLSENRIEKKSIPSEKYLLETNESTSGFRVLVVDDSVPMQKALEAEIKRLDAQTEIDFANTGEEALQYVEKNNYDFIFLDIIMPGIDGFETCTRMRKLPKLKKTPIIMLSAKTSPLDEVKGVMAGCTTYMTKPIVHEEFQKVIRRISKWIENISRKPIAS
jgi:twitching motility two-component system response regulator PilG